jgi:hypothetical protein
LSVTAALEHCANDWIHSAGVIFAGQLWAQVQRLEKKQSAMARQRAFPPMHSQGVSPRWLSCRPRWAQCADRTYTVPDPRQYWIYDCSIDA